MREAIQSGVREIRERESEPVAKPKRARLVPFFAAFGVIAVCTAVNWMLSTWLDLTDLAMVFLLGVVVIAYFYDRGAVIVSALAAVVAFDFFFVPPQFTLQVDHPKHVFTALVLLIVGIVISTLGKRARKQTRTAQLATLAVREERLRNSVLASLSHDLRTPLALIAGSASTLRDSASKLSASEQRQLLETVYEESQHVNVLVTDLLDMTRLDGGPVTLDRQWYPVEELVGAALERCKIQLTGHPVETRVPNELPLLRVDGVLIEKLLVNLLENAAKYTPTDAAILIGAECRNHQLAIWVEDDGLGIGAGLEEKLFEKFFRGVPEGAISGSGLGLSICRAIAELHGGEIRAGNRAVGGAVFTLSLPIENQPLSESIP